VNKRHLLKSVSLLWFSSLLGGASTFVIQILLAQQLTLNDFGLFAASYSFVGLFIPLAGFGIAQLWLKIYGEEGRGGQRWLNASFYQLLISCLLTITLITSWAFLGPNETESKFILLAFVLHVLGMVMLELIIAKFQLESRFISVSWWQFFPNILRLVFIFLLVFIGQLNLYLVGIVYALVGLGLIVLSAKQLYGMFFKGMELEESHHAKCNMDFLDDKEITLPVVFMKAWPFGLAVFFQLIYYQSDIVLLKYMVGNEVAATYNVAFVILAIVFILPSVLYQKFLMPKIHYWASHDHEMLKRAYDKGNKYMILIGSVSVFGIVVSSSWLISLLFGADYFDSIALLNILALSVPFIFIAYNSGAVLVTSHHLYRKVKYMGIVAILNVVLNVILIPEYGAEGAAISTVISNLLLFSLYEFAIRKHVFSVSKNV
jgi:O-antigen/teichoic acid export membrane protein